MEPAKRKHLMEFVNRNAGAASEVIGGIPDAIRLLLPDDYLNFVRETNGCEGFAGEWYLMLWPIEQLEQLNREYEAQEYVPDVLLFGSDGGGEALGFRRSGVQSDIVITPWIGMSPELCIKIADSFTELIAGVKMP
jgi:hypothetical protein